MPHPIHLIYLDAYHLDDPLYVPSLARMMGRLRRAVPLCLFLHGSGERAERLLEAEGRFPKKENGRVQARTPQEAALVEKALRQVNRQIVSTLTEEIIHAVGFQGTDRGLLLMDEGRDVKTGRMGWLVELIQKGAVPVLSALVHHPETAAPYEADLTQVMLAVAHALSQEDVRVVFFSRRDQPGVMVDDVVLDEVALEAVPAGHLPDPIAVQAVVEAGFAAFLTSASGLFGAEIPQGTNILRSKPA
ncbi:MAG TPA: hypothetical protein VKP65_16990 [Rhodothermales bacterium]|nr:hypothetical protein [Rhodothermales bacterium]